MLECDGYKMFKGKATITPAPTSPFKPFDAEGTWLYKPEYDCWYCKPDSPIFGHMMTQSFPAEVVFNFREDVG